MSYSEPKNTDTSKENPSNDGQAASVTETTELSEISNLSVQIKELIKKLDAPKRKDLWDKVGVITTLTGTVILAGISLYVTQSYQREEAQRTREYQMHESERASRFNQSQIEIQRAQVRVEELKAITALAPLLASTKEETRATGMQLLQAVKASGTAEKTIEISGAPNQSQQKPPTSLLDKFADIALSPKASPQDRITATQKIGEIATAKSASPAIRERAADIATKIATSKETPPEVQQAAANVITKIKQVTAEEAKSIISSQPITRKISEIILHHSSMPSASQYNGAPTIFSIAKFQTGQQGWNTVSWHYAIAPDGSVWLGAPLNESAIHTPGHQKNSASVLLIMNGDKELPTDAQRTSLVIVLRSLFSRLSIQASANSEDGNGFHFHSDYDRRGKTCPGSLLTKEMVLSWL